MRPSLAAVTRSWPCSDAPRVAPGRQAPQSVFEKWMGRRRGGVTQPGVRRWWPDVLKRTYPSDLTDDSWTTSLSHKLGFLRDIPISFLAWPAHACGPVL